MKRILIGFLAVFPVLTSTPATAQVFGSPELLSPSLVPSDVGNDRLPVIATNGGGAWIAAWESSDPLDGSIDTDLDILVSRSTDNGASWTPPAALNTNAVSDSGSDSDVQVATDGNGHWVAVWSSNDTFGLTIGYDNDILVARSTDDGATWTPPATLNTNASTDLGSDLYPVIAIDQNGNWVVVWASTEDLGATIGTDLDLLIARSFDNGVTWTAPAALNQNAAIDTGDDTAPALVTDGNGAWIVAWSSGDDLMGTIGGDADILFARSVDDGASWTTPAALNTNAGGDSGTDFAPRLAVDGLAWVALWASDDSLNGTIGTDVDILLSRSADGGTTWTAPTALDTTAAGDGSTIDHEPHVTNDGGGTWVATWTSENSLAGSVGNDGDIFLARSFDNGATWTAASVLNSNATTDSGADGTPYVASNGAGVWIAAWYSADQLGGTIGFDLDILVATASGNAATWTSPTPLNTNAAADPGYDMEAHAATDGVGSWVAVWWSTDSLGGTIGDDEDILIRTSSDDGATWSPVRALNINADVDSGGDGQPFVATDRMGRWICAWSSIDSLGGTIGTDNDILLARSNDNGLSWSPPEPLHFGFAETVTGSDSYPALAADSHGNWVAVWESTDELGGAIGTDPDILVSTSNDFGANWTTPVALNSNAATDVGADQSPRIATDDFGNWVVVWHSTDTLAGTTGFDQDVLFARSSDDGATWSAVAPLNTNASSDSGEDVLPRIAADGLGAWVVVWESTDDLGATIGTDSDILVSRSSNNGASWSAPLALAPGSATDFATDFQPDVSTNASGEWLAVWVSDNSLGATIGGDYDVLVSHSADNGATWTLPAALGPGAAGDYAGDVEPAVFAGAAGSWLALWTSEDSLGGRASHFITDIFYSRGGTCGDNVVGPGETCDDGNRDSGDCCDQDCQLEAAGSPCDLGKACSVDQCDAFGVCQVTGVLGCDDGNPCTRDSCESTLGCVNVVAPATSCNTTNAKAVLEIRDRDDDSRDSVSFRWLRGTTNFAELGAPASGTDYALCVYGDDTVVTGLGIPAAADCGSAPCWSIIGRPGSEKGLRFRDRRRPAFFDGLQTLVARAAVPGRASFTVRAQGENVPAIALTGGLLYPVTAQIVNSDGSCWQQEFNAEDEVANDGEHFKAVKR